MDPRALHAENTFGHLSREMPLNHWRSQHLSGSCATMKLTRRLLLLLRLSSSFHGAMSLQEPLDDSDLFSYVSVSCSTNSNPDKRVTRIESDLTCVLRNSTLRPSTRPPLRQGFGLWHRTMLFMTIPSQLCIIHYRWGRIYMTRKGYAAVQMPALGHSS